MVGEVPEYVNIRLHTSAVDADRVHVMEVAELTPPDHRPDRPDGGCVNVGMVAHQREPALRGRGGNLLSLGH